MKIEQMLQDAGAPFQATHHPLAYTANEVAAVVHISGKQFAKAVLYKADDSFVVAVLPACMHVDEVKLAEVTGAELLAKAPEEALKQVFPDCQVGAVPPFGRPYGVDLVLDDALTHCDEIAFQAGTHTDVIKMRYEDYARIESPHVVSFATPGC